jgi:hypothetical protein
MQREEASMVFLLKEADTKRRRSIHELPLIGTPWMLLLLCISFL